MARDLTDAGREECRRLGEADYAAITPEEWEEDPSITLADCVDYHIAVLEMRLAAEAGEFDAAPADNADVPF